MRDSQNSYKFGSIYHMYTYTLEEILNLLVNLQIENDRSDIEQSVSRAILFNLCDGKKNLSYKQINISLIR